MTSDSRPVCVYAMAGLKKNSTRLLITMCVGIALAMYGVYVQARTKSNPSYMSTFAMAIHWLSSCLGNKLIHPTKMLTSCQAKGMVQTVPHLLMRTLIMPIMYYSGIFNGFINLAQIILLKIYCRSLPATGVMIGLSAFGLLISWLCLIGSFATCKMMCFSCLGIHHLFIIYFSICRFKIIKNLLCPPNNTNEGNCIFGSSTTNRKPSTSTSNASGNDIRRRTGART